MDYIKDPQAIYQRSFAIIREEARLEGLGIAEQAIAIRMIHACGMTDLPKDLMFQNGFAQAACKALHSGKPIFVDAEMVNHGIIRRTLPAGVDVICTLNDPRAREIGVARGITRSAAAVDLWRERLDGAVTVIGNAPTALFRLLEIMDSGGPRPAAIVACPVGFVGAAESKEELCQNSRGVASMIVRGRRGGSAMAAAVINALTGDIA